MVYDIVIVGAGHGGAAFAAALRARGFAGSIGMLGEEPELPYERPPLSKEYPAGTRGFGDMLLRTAQFWQERHVAILPGQLVTRVDPEGHCLTTASGERFGYGQLIWAAGGHARRLICAGHHLAGVHAVRSRADVDRLRLELATTRRVAVIGGGYIGLESAAVLTELGFHVTVLEAQDRVLARVAGAQLSRFYEAEHRAHGVDIRLGVTVTAIEAADGRAAGVRLADGELIRAEMVIAGIGIIPATQPLQEAGAHGENGVSVDELCRTSLPDVWALGDCALHASRFAGGEAIRLESVQNANDMAATVAGALTGAPSPYQAVPWFWSNQYDLRLQTVGLSLGHDETMLRGDMAARSFSLVYLRRGQVIALDCVNATRDYVQGKRLVAAGYMADPARLANSSIALKDL